MDDGLDVETFEDEEEENEEPLDFSGATEGADR